MTTEKLVMNSLFGKTKLTSQKVELGVVEDIAKIAADANSTLKVLIDDKTLLSNADKAIATAMSNADKVAANSQKNAQKALALLPKIGTILEKADKSARELGLDSKAIQAEMMKGDYENLVNVFDKHFGHFVTLYR